MDFSLQLLPEQPLAELIDVVRLADELGFRGCYSADETYHKDRWILFGAAAPGTRRIRFGPEVSGVILRDPTLIAQQAATLDELTGGRAEIVFSIGNIAMLDQYGVRWQGTGRSHVCAKRTRSCARSSPRDARRLPGGVLPVFGTVHGRATGTATLPIKIGAMTGPGSFRLAGEIADGVHVACAHPSETLFFAAQKVREGADRVGRRLDSSFDLCASVLGAIAGDSAAAKETARVAAAFYISSMAPELIERHGIDYADVRPVVDAFGRGDVERALELTTPEIGERLSIAGDPAEWIERLRSDFVPHGPDGCIVAPEGWHTAEDRPFGSTGLRRIRPPRAWRTA